MKNRFYHTARDLKHSIVLTLLPIVVLAFSIQVTAKTTTSYNRNDITSLLPTLMGQGTRTIPVDSIATATEEIRLASEAKPWKVALECAKEGTLLTIDLYEETVDVPGMDMFGPMNGYLGGKIFGVWMITSFKVENETQATIKLSNDLGSETQTCLLTIQPDSTYLLELKGGVVVKRVVGKKLEKVVSKMVFVKKS